MSGFNGNRNRRRGGPSGSSGQRRGGGRTAPDKSVLQEGIYVNDRFLHAFASCIGCPAQVTVKNGKIYEGILRTTSPKVQVVLERAHEVEESNEGPAAVTSRNQIINTLIFEKNDIVMITVTEVNLEYAVVDSFTDGAISKCNGIVREKELQPWEADTSAELGGLESIEDRAGVDDQGWDPNEMFNINEEKFNIKSDYDPSLTQYTTPLHRSDTQEFRQREARAHQLAMEIERGADYAKRSALENGDSEEMMFSAVVRPAASSVGTTPVSGQAVAATSSTGSSSGKYVAPHLRPSGATNLTPAQRSQQLSSNLPAARAVPPAAAQEATSIVSSDESNGPTPRVNGAEMNNADVAATAGAENTGSPSVQKHSGIVEGLKEFQTNFKLIESHSPAAAAVAAATAVVTDASTVNVSPVPLSSTLQPPATVSATVHQTSPPQSSPTVHLPTTTTAAALQHPVQPPAAESVEDKTPAPAAPSADGESVDVAKKSNLNPLAKEFNPITKPMPPPPPPRAMPSTTPPRPLSVPPSPVSTFPGSMAGPQVVYSQQQVLFPIQQQPQQPPPQGGPRYQAQQQKRVTVSARGTGELNQPTQSTLINGTQMLPQPVLQFGQGHVTYQPGQQFIPVGPFHPGQYRLVVQQQPIMNMQTASHDPNMAQIIGSSSQPGMYVAHYTPHSGAQPPPPLQNHGPSPQQSQNHSGGPTPSASSGHQTPTPNQHTQYAAMQQVGPLSMMPQSSMAMAQQQQHMYHAMQAPLQMQQQVTPGGQPQGVTPQSPQVAFTSGPIPLYSHHHQPNAGIMAFVPTSQPPLMGAPSQSGGMPPPGQQHQGHLMMAQQQQTPQHPSMQQQHGGGGTMPSQMMMHSQGQQQVVQNPGVGPGGHQYVQSHGMPPGAGGIPQGHQNMSGQHVMSPMYSAVPPHAMQQQGGQQYQHGTQ